MNKSAQHSKKKLVVTLEKSKLLNLKKTLELKEFETEIPQKKCLKIEQSKNLKMIF